MGSPDLLCKTFLLKRNLKAKASLGFICQCKIKINQSSAMMAVFISSKPPFSSRLYSIFTLVAQQRCQLNHWPLHCLFWILYDFMADFLSSYKSLYQHKEKKKKRGVLLYHAYHSWFIFLHSVVYFRGKNNKNLENASQRRQSLLTPLHFFFYKRDISTVSYLTKHFVSIH